jgi:hypothetical protein
VESLTFIEEQEMRLRIHELSHSENLHR